jgi:hypothetical protein
MVKRDGLAGTRKAEKALRLGRTVSGAGPSLLESLEDMLYDAMITWREYKEFDGVNPVEQAQARGIVRGLARAIAKIRLPYEDQRIVVKSVEKEFLKKVKEGEENASR